MTLIYPAATWRPVVSHGGARTVFMGLVEHVTTNNFSPYGFFSDPANQASSHLWINFDGSVEQYVSLDVASWAQAGGNYGWTSCEIAGKEGTAKTPAQSEALAQLFAWGSAQPSLRWPICASDSPDVSGLGWHGMGGKAWGNHPYCPGEVRLAQRPAVLARVQQIVNDNAAPDPAPPIKSGDRMLVLVTDDPHLWEVVGSRLEHINAEAWAARCVLRKHNGLGPETIWRVNPHDPIALLPKVTA